MNFTCNSLKPSFFPEDVESAKRSQNYFRNSLCWEGIIALDLNCQNFCCFGAIPCREGFLLCFPSRPPNYKIAVTKRLKALLPANNLKWQDSISSQMRNAIILWHVWTGDGPNTVLENTVSSTDLSRIFRPSPSSGREITEFLSAFNLCAKANSPTFSKTSLTQNSVSSLFRNSTLDIVFRPPTTSAVTIWFLNHIRMGANLTWREMHLHLWILEPGAWVCNPGDLLESRFRTFSPK